MEAVSLDAHASYCRGRANRLATGARVPMKRSIEAGDLHEIRARIQELMDRCEVLLLVNGCQRNEAVEALKN